MAERIDTGYLDVVMEIGDIEIPEGTPITIKMTPTRCIITVIYGEHDGMAFTIPKERVDAWVTLVL